MRKFIKKIKNSIIAKILGVLWKVLWWAIELVIIFIAIIIVTQRVTNNEKAFLGFRIFSVATGSMEPEYAVGDILIAKEKDPATIVVGDNIVYLGSVADYRGKIITHNVIEVEQNEEGDYLFHTKGIANTIEDPVVHEDQLYGVIFYNNELLAWICKILTNRYGLYFFVIVPIITYFFIGLIRAQGERIEQEREADRLRKEKQKKRSKKQTIEVIEELPENVEETPDLPKKKKTTTKKKADESKATEENRTTAKRSTATTKKKANTEGKSDAIVENKKTTKTRTAKSE
ncbi:MAG: signal peptidase I [Clostridia bacterium]|nr:signal peptidase I [Clostridia bacterium]